MSAADRDWRPNANQMHALDLMRAAGGRARVGNTTGYPNGKATVARRTAEILAEHELVELDACCGIVELIER